MTQVARLDRLIGEEVSPQLRRIDLTKSHMMNDSPFFGASASKLHIIETDAVPTLRTNGTWLKFNPAYVAQLDDAELTFAIAHEAFHCCLRHPFRLEGKDHDLANEAADYVVNGELVRAGFKLPAGVLFDPRFNDLGIEKVYAILKHERDEERAQQPEPEPDDQPGEDESAEDAGEDGAEDAGEDEPQPEDNDQAPDEDAEDADSGDDEPGEDGAEDGEPGDEDATKDSYSGYEPGELEAAPEPGELTEGEDGAQVPAQTEDDWEIGALQAAAIAEKLAPGTGAAGAERAIKAAREPQVDWREMLRQFIEQTVPQDYSWQRMNPMLLADDIYQPGLTKENTPSIGILVDTSASITDDMIAAAGAELADIQSQARPELMTVIYCDTAIGGIEDFGPDDPIDLHPAGGGGTYLTPALEEFTRRKEEDGVNFAALVVFTDLYTERLPDPGIPTLFIVPLWSTATEPEYGTVVRVPAETW